MYIRKPLRANGSLARLSSDVDLSTCRKYRPFSYYVLGGIDLDGDALKDNAQTTFDSPDDISGVDCSVDGTSDPRVSAFDIIEKAGVQSYERYKQEASRQAQEKQQQQQETTEK